MHRCAPPRLLEAHGRAELPEQLAPDGIGEAIREQIESCARADLEHAQRRTQPRAGPQQPPIQRGRAAWLVRLHATAQALADLLEALGERRRGHLPGTARVLVPSRTREEARERRRLAAQHEIVQSRHQAQRRDRAGGDVDARECPSHDAIPPAVLGRPLQQRDVQRRAAALLQPAREAAQALAQGPALGRALRGGPVSGRRATLFGAALSHRARRAARPCAALPRLRGVPGRACCRPHARAPAPSCGR